MSSHPMQEGVSTAPAVAMGLFIGIIVSLFLGIVLLEIFPPTGWYQDHSFNAPLSWLVPYMLGDVQHVWQDSYSAPLVRLITLPGKVWKDCVRNIDLGNILVLRLSIIFAVASLSGLVAAGTFYGASEPTDSLTHLSGRRFWRGYAATKVLRDTLAKANKVLGSGLVLAPGIAISRELEVQHFGVFGTTGSGKTTILRFWLGQIIMWAISRKDRVLIHDTKGDMLAGLPVDQFVLFAPHDKRSHAWDVARDTTTTQAARELSARAIRDSRDPMWAAAAREIFTGLIVSLQRTKPSVWSWRDLAKAVFLPVSELRGLLLDAYPPAALYIELTDDGTPTKTTHSILISMWADVVSLVLPLADAWGAVPPARRISLTEWITDKSGKQPRVLVLQRSPQHPALSLLWIGAAIDRLASIATSPALPESKIRRIWFVLDEFKQLGKLEAFLQLLEVGRSKGIVCILAFQDVQQLVAVYGDAVTKTILSLLGIKIIGRLPAGPSARAMAQEWIGQRRVAWREQTVTWSDGKSSYTTQTLRDTLPVVSEEYLESRLGVDWRGVKALVLGFGDVYELRWPLLFWPARRLASKLADWVSR